MIKHHCRSKKITNYDKAEIPLSSIDEDLIEQIKEDMLEHLFGTESKMTRHEFLERLKSNKCNWMLDAETVRTRVKRYIRARQKGVHVMDQMADETTPQKQNGRESWKSEQSAQDRNFSQGQGP